MATTMPRLRPDRIPYKGIPVSTRFENLMDTLEELGRKLPDEDIACILLTSEEYVRRLFRARERRRAQQQQLS